MGQVNTKHTTRVANVYHEDIRACVTANVIEVYEEKTGTKGKFGWGGAEAGLAHNTHQKREFKRQDPGFATIKPGSHFGFAQSGPDGHVFVTIKIGSDTPHDNVQVHNGSNVLVDRKGALRNVRDDQIWPDTSLDSHLNEAAASIDDISKQDLELISKPHPAEDSGEALRRYLNKGQVKKYFGTQGVDAGQMYGPHGICSTATDDIVVAEFLNDRIQIFDVGGQVKGVFGGYGSAEGQFQHVNDVSVTSRGRIVASDNTNHRIQIFDEQGKFVRKFGSEGSGDGEMKFPGGVATDDKGLIYVCGERNHRVQVFTEEGKFVRKFGSEMKWPRYLSVTSNGVVVSDPGIHRVHVFDTYGRHLFHFGAEGTKKSQFNRPSGIATDDHGNIIVADDGNHRVQVFTSFGAFVSCFGSYGSDPGQMNRPFGVCLLSDGGIAMTDWSNSRVQIF